MHLKINQIEPGLSDIKLVELNINDVIKHTSVESTEKPFVSSSSSILHYYPLFPQSKIFSMKKETIFFNRSNQIITHFPAIGGIW